MRSTTIVSIRVLGTIMIIAGMAVFLWERPHIPESGPLAVPSLTAWGKVFSFLLLMALGVAYLVWRRPVVRARAILETSPLGTQDRAAPLVDWVLYIKTLLVTDALALAGVFVSRLSGLFVLKGIDTLGVLASGAIVAFVLHLLLLGRRSGPGAPRKR